MSTIDVREEKLVEYACLLEQLVCQVSIVCKVSNLSRPASTLAYQINVLVQLPTFDEKP